MVSVGPCFLTPELEQLAGLAWVALHLEAVCDITASASYIVLIKNKIDGKKSRKVPGSRLLHMFVYSQRPATVSALPATHFPFSPVFPARRTHFGDTLLTSGDIKIVF